VNQLVPLINNTPIRGLLDRIDPAGASAVRLLGAPVSTTMSPDGMRLYVVTAPVTSTLPFLSFLLPSTSSVTEIDTKTNKVVGVPIAFGGSPLGPVVVSPDGTQAYLTTSSGDRTRVTIINTGNSTFARAGALAGSVQGVADTADGLRVFLGTMDSTANEWTVALVDGRTGAQVGKLLQIAGSPSGELATSPDGGRAYLTTIVVAGDTRSTVVTVIDTADNTLMGTTVLDDSIADGGVVVSPDGAHAVQVTNTTSRLHTTVTMLDPGTGAVVGAPAGLDGLPSTYPAAIYVDGGDRLAVATYTGSQSSLTILDAADGTVVGTPVVMEGGGLAVVDQVMAFGEGDDRLYILSRYWDADEREYKTLATVVDTTDSTVVGTPLVLDGELPPTNSVSVSPDRSRVFQTLRPASVSQGQPYISSVAMIGTDGTLISAPASVPGSIYRPVVFSPDGSRAYQLSENATSVVTAIDATTGAVIGSPVAVNGRLGDDLFVAADGASAYVSTRITFFRLLLPIPLPFPIEFSLSITHVNAVDTADFVATI
jgi:DNA-binding beta-propeller fold protein YncE